MYGQRGNLRAIASLLKAVPYSHHSITHPVARPSKVMSIVDSYDMRSDRLRTKCEEQLPTFQKCWQEVDPDGLGIIDPYLLKKFIELLPPPLGIPSSASQFEIDTAVRVLKKTDGYDYTFSKTLLIMASTFMLQKKRSEAR